MQVSRFELPGYELNLAWRPLGVFADGAIKGPLGCLACLFLDSHDDNIARLIQISADPGFTQFAYNSLRLRTVCDCVQSVWRLGARE